MPESTPGEEEERECICPRAHGGTPDPNLEGVYRDGDPDGPILQVKEECPIHGDNAS